MSRRTATIGLALAVLSSSFAAAADREWQFSGELIDEQEYFLGTTTDEPDWIVEQSDGLDGVLFTLYHPSVESWTRRVVFGAVAAEPGHIEIDAVLAGDFGVERYGQFCDLDLTVFSSVEPVAAVEDPEIDWGYRQYTRLLGCRHVAGEAHGVIDAVRAAAGQLAIYYGRHTWKLAPFLGTSDWPLSDEEIVEGLMRSSFVACNLHLKDPPCPEIVKDIHARRPRRASRPSAAER